MPKKPLRHRPLRAAFTAAKAQAPHGKTFAQVMAQAGAVPLGKGVNRVPLETPSPARAPLRKPPVFELENDEDWVEGYRAGLPPSVRRRVGGTPTATLDLHGHDSDAAKRAVASFLAKERAKRRDVVLLVVGRGHHSQGGLAVLRHEVSSWLTTLPTAAHVLAFRTAPRELGGTGAVVVLLAR